ncbi:hypothetical protein BJX61DRAFT_538819 [Aspergillus egyptiacus]|nr:hypothetical protein BJX61DRAFT_538819 [Aspergillus egyptiacus]
MSRRNRFLRGNSVRSTNPRVDQFDGFERENRGIRARARDLGERDEGEIVVYSEFEDESSVEGKNEDGEEEVEEPAFPSGSSSTNGFRPEDEDEDNNSSYGFAAENTAQEESTRLTANPAADAGRHPPYSYATSGALQAPGQACTSRHCPTSLRSAGDDPFFRHARRSNSGREESNTDADPELILRHAWTDIVRPRRDNNTVVNIHLDGETDNNTQTGTQVHPQQTRNDFTATAPRFQVRTYYEERWPSESR